MNFPPMPTGLRLLSLAPLFLAGTLVAQSLPIKSNGPSQPPVAADKSADKTPSPDVKLPSVAPESAPGTAGNYSSSTAEGGADKLFDVKSDSIDPESGTMQWKGKTFNIGDSRAMRARFDRFLAAPPPESGYEEYVKLLEDISEKLSSMNFTDTETNRQKRIQEAWNLLFKASKSEFDGDASLTLANQVMKAWRQRTEVNDLNVSIEQQKQLAKRQEDIINDRADSIAERQAGRKSLTTTSGKTSQTQTKTEDATGKRELAGLESEHTASKADIAKTSVQKGLMGVQSKLDFQSMIVSFLAERRFRHCLIASAFYRQIYKASHQEVQVGAKQMKELFPLSDFVPSLESLDSISRDAIKDVGMGLRTFEKMDKVGNKFGAFERLQETYFLGEYEPGVIRLTYEQKQAYADMTRDVRDLQKFGDERDLDAAEETLTRICAVAKDFPAARIRSKIKTAKKASDMAVMAAKQTALLYGKEGVDKASEQIALATKIWPLNPAITEFMSDMTGRADIGSKLIPEFDKLHEGGKFRELYDRKEQFGLALVQDKTRLEKLNGVLEKIGRLEMMLAQANALATQGNRTLAWDVVTEAERTDPSDTKVGALRSLLAPQVADYAKLLADASRAESESRPGPALAAYLAAQDLNRGSKFCQEALDRVTKSLLDSAPTAGAL
jgi:hypothetical protein